MAKKPAKPKHVEPEVESQEAPEEESETATLPLPKGAITKAAAMRAALDAGMESPTDGVNYVIDHFGIEVSKPQFSAAKSDYNKAAAKVPAPKHAPEAAPASKSDISKAEAVRQALAAGCDMPEEGTDFIRSNYGIEMEKQTFSSYKAQEKARQGKKAGKRGRKPKAVSQAVEGYLAPPPKSREVGEEGDIIASLEALKPLIASHGAERLKRLVDLLG